MLVVTHDREISRVADRVIELWSWHMIADGPPSAEVGGVRRCHPISLTPSHRVAGGGTLPDPTDAVATRSSRICERQEGREKDHPAASNLAASALA